MINKKTIKEDFIIIILSILINLILSFAAENYNYMYLSLVFIVFYYLERISYKHFNKYPPFSCIFRRFRKEEKK